MVYVADRVDDIRMPPRSIAGVDDGNRHDAVHEIRIPVRVDAERATRSGETEFAFVNITLQSAQQPTPARDCVDCLARHGAGGEHLAINLRRDSAISYTRF